MAAPGICAHFLSDLQCHRGCARDWRQQPICMHRYSKSILSGIMQTLLAQLRQSSRSRRRMAGLLGTGRCNLLDPNIDSEAEVLQSVALLPSLQRLTWIWTSWRPVAMWQLRSVPGGRGMFILGHLPQAIYYDLMHFLDNQYKKHVKEKSAAFQTWIGTRPFCRVMSVDVSQRLLQRFKNRPDFNHLALRFGVDNVQWNRGLLWLPMGEKWRIARKAFEAALMHPRALASQAPFIRSVIQRSSMRLEALADSDQPVDMLAFMNTYTMDVTARVAFGVDVMGTAQKPDAATVPCTEGWWLEYSIGSPEFASLMFQSAVMVMRCMDTSSASAYTSLILLFPGFKQLFRILAWLLPDARLKRQTEATRGLREALKVIMATWHQQQQQQQHGLRKQGAEDISPSGPVTIDTATATPGAAAISGDGFLTRLLSGLGLNADEHLESADIVGNAINMVISGYETTGAALSSTIYYLAANPAVQAKAQQEVETVLQGKDANMDDVEHLTYLSAVFMEAIRLRPPVASLVREVSDPSVDLGNNTIVPHGTALAFPVFSYNRDMAIFPRADEFIPERHIQPGHEHLAPNPPHAFLPFGLGARMCPGYKLAQLEGRLMLAHLLQRFTFETIPGTPPPVWRTSLAYAPNSVILSVKRRL